MQLLPARDLAHAPRLFFTHLTTQPLQIPVQHIMNQRGFPRAAHARDAAKHTERNIHIQLLEVVLSRATDGKSPRLLIYRRALASTFDFGWHRICLRQLGTCDRPPLHWNRHTLPPKQIIPRQRLHLLTQLLQRSAIHQLATLLPTARSDVDEVVRAAHHRFFVLHHQQRVALVPQPFHHANEPPDVARMQPDAWLIQHEQRVHQRSPETRREIHPLQFTTTQSARLTIQVQIS